MLGFMSDVTAKVASDDAMPRRVVLFVELFLDVRGDVLLNVVLFQRLRRAVDGVLLHVLGHVSVLDDGFSVRHFAGFASVLQTVGDGQIDSAALNKLKLLNYKLPPC